MKSIKQNLSFPEQVTAHQFQPLPDFRNLGVCLRVLVLVNGMTLGHAIALSTSPIELLSKLMQLSLTVQPILVFSVLLLYVINPILKKTPIFWALIFTLSLITLSAQVIIYILANALPLGLSSPSWHTGLLVLIMCSVVLVYFNLRRRALTPAISEARLQALQARIRPHFLFNCINAVLSIVRSDPKLAESALEDMADLFRVLMADNRNLVPLAQELALSRQYLALEKLRLDERLVIVWKIDNVPPDALIPPLVLQPLLENAVYHGVEPMPYGGDITIHLFTEHKEIHLILTNPYPEQGGHHAGNKMALSNIRERLALHFDAEARLMSKVVQIKANNFYEVHIVIPYQKNASS